MYKVIFDTNCIRNDKSLEFFLGNRVELLKFQRVADIFVPKIVFEEIFNQKRIFFQTEKHIFRLSPYYKLLGLSIDNINTEDIINELISKETIVYNIIDITRETALEDIKKLVIRNLPPFEVGNDKGFKDALLYITVLDYLTDNPGEQIYLVTDDIRLTEAFADNKKVSVVKTYDEFESKVDLFVYSDYFLSVLAEEWNEPNTENSLLLSEFAKSLSIKNIKKAWINIEENWIVELVFDEMIVLVEVDFTSKVIVSTYVGGIDAIIESLINSGSFAGTHSAIESVIQYIKYASDEQIKCILQAGIENSQISSIATDLDVKQFFTDTFRHKQSLLTDAEQEDFKLKYLE